MIGMVAYGYIYILYFSKKKNPILLDLFVDGEWMLACISIILLSRVGMILKQSWITFSSSADGF